MDKPSLRDTLSYYGVDLHSQRREQSVNCPVHEETHPSCSVNEDDGLWNCLACGAGGDSWTLIMLKENLDGFRAAQQWAETHLGFNGNVGARPARSGRSGASLARGKGAFRPGFKRVRSLSG